MGMKKKGKGAKEGGCESLRAALGGAVMTPVCFAGDFFFHVGH